MEQSETISGIITRNSRHVSQQDLDLGKCGGDICGVEAQSEEKRREVDYRSCSSRASGVEKVQYFIIFNNLLPILFVSFFVIGSGSGRIHNKLASWIRIRY